VSKPNITVVGDLILDRYLIGDATKLNPEQPGVVIRVDREENRLGGAAAVAMLTSSMGANVTLAGVVGRDEAGDTLRQLIDEHDIKPHVWTADRPTTWKQRIVTRGQLRPDRCDFETTTPIESDIERHLADAPLGDMLLISDYGKGVCTPSLLRILGARARGANIPILVDPARGRDWCDYGQVTLIKANWVEATEMVGSDELVPKDVASQLSRRFHCHVVVTLGGEGLVCAERDKDAWHLAAKRVKVHDVCGAGDTVLAAIGVAMASGSPLYNACQTATDAAGDQVSCVGVTSFCK
jgi:D-beta-D-heptose 7-phosphate kinase / D-beta-D-heptose 1-phosphate adenosyltransferase